MKNIQMYLKPYVNF